jgi:hypothetical protein
MEGSFGACLFGFSTLPSGVQFPGHWQRSFDAAGKYEHIIPDGPGKADELKQISPVLCQILDGADEGVE